MDILLDTIRSEIAVCLEKAYEKISLKDAARMLYLPNEEVAKNFGVKVFPINIKLRIYNLLKHPLMLT